MTSDASASLQFLDLFSGQDGRGPLPADASFIGKAAGRRSSAPPAQGHRTAGRPRQRTSRRPPSQPNALSELERKQ